MQALSQAPTKRLVAIHGWSGTLLGLLLYAVIFTGAIVVYAGEVNIWSQGVLAYERSLGTKIDRDFRKAARGVDPKYYEEVIISRTTGGDIRYLFHGHVSDPETGQVSEHGVRITVDRESGETLERLEGYLGDFPGDPASALSRFWVDLHVQLYVPAPWGLILTGILGLSMMVAAISGILIHKHLIRDMFLSARDTARLVGARDLHVLAGTWGIPFAILLAFTGAFLSFALSLGIPVMAMIAFGGDQAALLEVLLGGEETKDLTPAPLASLDYIVADAISRTDSIVRSIQIFNYGSASADVKVVMAHAAGDLTPQTLGYDGVTRAFEGDKPIFGQTESLGDTLFGLIIPLHFGNFAGLASKTVWLGLGLAMAYVTATGMLLWTKRREEEPLWHGFRHWVMVFVWGLPLSMLFSAVAYFVSAPLSDPDWWTPAGFLIGAILVVALGFNRNSAEAQLRWWNGAICLALPILRHLMGGSSWSEALMAGAGEVLVIDLLLLIAGAVLLRLLPRRRTREEPVLLVREPAE